MERLDHNYFSYCNPCPHFVDSNFAMVRIIQHFQFVLLNEVVRVLNKVHKLMNHQQVLSCVVIKVLPQFYSVFRFSSPARTME